MEKIYNSNSISQKTKRSANKLFIAFAILLGMTTTNLQAQLTTYSFTAAGATGQNGPSQLQINAAYALTNLNGSVTVTGGIQSFTVPSTGPYRIKAAGAQGGHSIYNGGLGASMMGDFTLTAGQVLNIVVGQKGGDESGDNNRSGGGGGGSFVYTGSTLHIAAGGGAGKCGYSGGIYNFVTVDANTVTAGNDGSGWNIGDGGLGGTLGNGGISPGCGGAGAGWLTNGSAAGGMEGISLAGGWLGGSPPSGGGFGGFGGAGAGGVCYGGGGGGGGYSGGGGGTDPGSGGGAGSYNTGINQVQIPAINSGDGIVTITKLYGVEISQTGLLTCFGQSLAVLTGTASGGTAPYTYTWLPTGGNSSVAVNLGAGTYTCMILDALNAPAQSIWTINQPALLTASITNSGSVTCNGGVNGTASVSVGGGIPSYLYNWVPSGGFGPVAFGLAGGNYTVYILDANGCQTSKSVTINQPAFPLSVNASSNEICAGSGVSLLASGATNYTWTGGITNGVIFTPTLTNSYTVTGTNSLSGCSNSLAVTVTVNPKPIITTGGSGTICPGQIIALNADGAFTYTWNPGNTNGFLINVSPTVSTTYSVIGTSDKGCLSANTETASVFVTNQNCVGIEEITNSLSGLLVYPNPTNGELTLELNNGLKKNIEITDVTGRKVLLSQSENDKIYLNINHLANGVYYAKIKSNGGMKVVKIVKQ